MNCLTVTPSLKNYDMIDDRCVLSLAHIGHSPRKSHCLKKSFLASLKNSISWESRRGYRGSMTDDITGYQRKGFEGLDACGLL